MHQILIQAVYDTLPNLSNLHIWGEGARAKQPFVPCASKVDFFNLFSAAVAYPCLVKFRKMTRSGQNVVGTMYSRNLNLSTRITLSYQFGVEKKEGIVIKFSENQIYSQVWKKIQPFSLGGSCQTQPWLLLPLQQSQHLIISPVVTDSDQGTVTAIEAGLKKSTFGAQSTGGCFPLAPCMKVQQTWQNAIENLDQKSDVLSVSLSEVELDNVSLLYVDSSCLITLLAESLHLISSMTTQTYFLRRCWHTFHLELPIQHAGKQFKLKLLITTDPKRGLLPLLLIWHL